MIFVNFQLKQLSAKFLLLLISFSCSFIPISSLPGPSVSVTVTRCALVEHLYTYAPPRCRTSQYYRTFVPLPVSLWNDLADPIFDGVGLSGFKSRANAFLLALAALSLLQSSTIFPFLFFLSIGWICGAEVFGLIGCISLSLSLALQTSFNDNNSNNNNNNNNIP